VLHRSSFERINRRESFYDSFGLTGALGYVSMPGRNTKPTLQVSRLRMKEEILETRKRWKMSYHKKESDGGSLTRKTKDTFKKVAKKLKPA